MVNEADLNMLLQTQELGEVVQIFSINSTQEHGMQLEVECLVNEYDDLFQEPKSLPPNRAHDHHIPLKSGSEPVSCRPYRCPYVQKTEIENFVKELLQSGIIQFSQSPFAASPVILVKKKDDTWRICVDYRELNKLNVKDKFPIPVIDELLDELHGAMYFINLDLRSGYHQIRVAKEDIPKTAFKTHHEHYEFMVMPSGLTNAPASFQALMNDVFHEQLRKFILVFFYDILIYSKSWAQHMTHLRVTFDLLRQYQLFVKKSKCSFGQREVEYLGHIISQQGVAADPAKVEAMVRWPLPTTVKALRGFLGLTGYYRRFVRGYGGVSKPLTVLLQKNKFEWNDEDTMAFQKLKSLMSTTPVLAMPDFSLPFVIETDACYNGLGAVM